MKLIDFTPVTSDIDWQLLEDSYPTLVNTLLKTPQDEYHHAEGDVWTHTKMVVSELVSTSEWDKLSVENKRIMFLASLLHDVAKPLCTEYLEGGRISSPGHSRKGSIDARILLWREGVDFKTRETIARLIGSHQKPFFALTKEDPLLELRVLSREMPLDLLFLLAKADGLGRLTNPATERQKTLDNIDVATLMAEEEGILHTAYQPADEDTWLKYVDRKGQGIDPAYSIYQEQQQFEVIIMSGLPGMGKDTWISKNCKSLPVVSYDATREIMGIEHGDDQGQLASIVKEQAREHLRARQPFVWNATHISPSMRQKTLGLLHAYGAYTRIVYIEAATEKEWRMQNKSRSAYVPERALDSMLFKWEVPIENEVHQVDYVINGSIQPLMRGGNYAQHIEAPGM